MQIQALHTVHKSGWTPAYDWWADHQTDHASAFMSCARWIETVPVMPATVLGLELLLQDPSLNLQMASDLILKDVGATLLIMRLVALEFIVAEERPARMADCLSALETATWFAALSANGVPFSKTPSEVSGLWKHCRSVAQYARLIAESLGEVKGEDAYLAGLLHEVENMATVLGKRVISHDGGPQLHEILAPSTAAALLSAKQRGSGSVWRYILASAHALATAGAAGENKPADVLSKPFVI